MDYNNFIPQCGYIKFNQNLSIINYNKQFEQIFNSTFRYKNLFSLNLDRFIDVDLEQVSKAKYSSPSPKSLLLLKTITIDLKSHLFFFYISYEYKDGYYNAVIINWLNWINSIATSLHEGYKIIRNLNKNGIAGNLLESSDIHSFKALTPLLSINSNIYQNTSSISPYQIYDILHPFINNRRNEDFTKDYLRNTLSRLKTSLKEQTKDSYLELNQAISNSNAIDLEHLDGNMCIPYTSLRKDIVYYGVNDTALQNFAMIKLNNTINDLVINS